MSSNQIFINQNPEEGIIKNETDCVHENINFNQLHKFPYCLIGRTVSEFTDDKICKSGVGILIGPSTVLTAGHNLTNINKQNEVKKASSVSFTLGVTGTFEPFDSIYTSEYFIPSQFLEGISHKNAKMQLLNDWALVYLPSSLGDSVKTLFNLKGFSSLTVKENGLFSFFVDNVNQNISKLTKLSPEISIIGYSDINNYCNNTEKEKEIGVNSIINNDEKEKEKKDININISISHNREEGFIKSSYINSNNKNNLMNKIQIKDSFNSNSNNNNRKDSFEYMIIKNRCKNKLSDDQIVLNKKQQSQIFMSESKGKLDNFDEGLKYKISTYKGQSGSPIFLKIRKIKSDLQNKYDHQNEFDKNPFYENLDITNLNNEENDFIYIFIGIHSRRGPLLFDSIMYKDDENKFQFDNNLMLPLINNVEDEVDKVETSVKKIKSMSICQEPNNDKDKSEINKIMVNGVCDFNEGLLIMGNNLNSIFDAVQPYDKYIKKPCLNSINYKSVTITINGDEKVFGLFHKNSKLETLFEFGESLLSVNKEYVILNLTSSKQQHEKKFNSKYDNSKTLCQVLEEDDFIAFFDVEINMRYGDELGKKVLSKYMEIYDVTLEEIKNDFKNNHLKPLFDVIFDEISIFSEIYSIYGRLFNKIKSYILLNIDS